jgi:hypothetical protein
MIMIMIMMILVVIMMMMMMIPPGEADIHEFGVPGVGGC